MSKLTADERKKLDEKEFVYGKERRYPIHDDTHATAALSRVAQHGTTEEKKRVKEAVCKRYPGRPSCNSAYQDPFG